MHFDLWESACGHIGYIMPLLGQFSVEAGNGVNQTCVLLQRKRNALEIVCWHKQMVWHRAFGLSSHLLARLQVACRVSVVFADINEHLALELGYPNPAIGGELQDD